MFSIGQIPKGHFLDADDTAEKGYKLKPFKQEAEGIYHYAVLTELPFANNCANGLSEKEQITCSEQNLRKLIYQNLSFVNDYKGNVYVYLTVTKEKEITNITVNSYPKSESLNNSITESIKAIEAKEGKYNDEIVTSRLWTSFTFPSTSKELFSESLAKMQKDENPEYKNYEYMIFDATQYIFSNPIYPDGKEFAAATQIVDTWLDVPTDMNLPTFGNFYDSLDQKINQKFLYIVAMVNYQLNQKINFNRVLKCEKTEGQRYSEQDDVREVQLEGAKILLEFMGNEKNNAPMTSKTKKYYKAYEKNKLEKEIFE